MGRNSRKRFRTYTRRPGESPQELTQNLEGMVHKAYPRANPDLMTVLFIDAIDSPLVQMQVQQASPASLNEALASALEREFMVKARYSLRG